MRMGKIEIRWYGRRILVTTTKDFVGSCLTYRLENANARFEEFWSKRTNRIGYSIVASSLEQVIGNLETWFTELAVMPERYQVEGGAISWRFSEKLMRRACHIKQGRFLHAALGC